MIYDIIAAGIAALIFGMIWHNPKVFGKYCIKSTKGKPEYWAPIVAALSYMIMAYVLKMFLGYASIADVTAGIKIALWLWLGFIATTSLSPVLWEKKPLKLWILGNAYNALALVLMTWILLSWV